MGFWNKLGKIALTAAPYVAAPFTGGASLAFTGASTAALNKWNEHDAKKAAEKGLAPSKFDRYLGYAGTGASIATGLGAFSGLGSMGSKSGSVGKTPSTSSFANNLGKGNSSGANFGYAGATGDYSGITSAGNQLSGWQNALNKYNQYSGYAQPAINALQNYRQGGSQNNPYQYSTLPINGGPSGGYVPNQQQYYNPQFNMGPSQSYNQPQSQGQMRYPQQSNSSMGMMDQRSPNLALSINQGRMDAIRNQPFRSGYPVNVQGSDDQLINYNMGPIYPNNGPMPASEGGNYGPWAGGYGVVNPERQPWQ